MYENGHRQPSAETLASMARYHHVSVDYLLGLRIFRILWTVSMRRNSIFSPTCRIWMSI